MTPVLNIEQIYIDHGIQYVTSGHKHSREGWVNTTCPFCSGNPGFHLGYNVRKGYFRCWRCGWHPRLQCLMNILHKSYNEITHITQQYHVLIPGQSADSDSTSSLENRLDNLSKKEPLTEAGIVLCEAQNYHYKYLNKRNYDIDELTSIWNIKFSSHLGPFRFRVIAPITHNNRIVSFVARDVTNKSIHKYITCPSRHEIIPHKRLLYGLDQIQDRRRVVVVEGVTDVWRLGPGAVATFGVEFTLAQIKLLRSFVEVFIFYDPDEAGQRSANKLQSILDSLGVSSHLIIDDVDPGELTNNEALALMQEIFS